MAGERVELRRLGQIEAALLGQANYRLTQWVLGVAFGGGGKAKDALRAGALSHGNYVCDGGFAFRERTRLVENDDLDFGRGLHGVRALEENTEFGALARACHHRGG